MSTARNPVFSWGRSFDEYQRMFQLSAPDLNSPILGCGIDRRFYFGIGFCSHVPDKSDTALLTNIVLENSADKVH